MIILCGYIMVVTGSTNRRLLLFTPHFFTQKRLSQKPDPGDIAVGSDLGLQEDESSNSVSDHLILYPFAHSGPKMAENKSLENKDDITKGIK